MSSNSDQGSVVALLTVSSEEKILAAVARIGFPSQVPVKEKKRTLRTVAYTVLFLHRAR